MHLVPTPTSYANRGFAHERKGDLNRAIADYTEAVRLAPSDGAVYTNRGRAFEKKKGELDRAIADYTEAIRLSPKRVAALANRGLAFLNYGDPDRAIADFKAALAVDPKQPIALAGLRRARTAYQAKR